MPAGGAGGGAGGGGGGGTGGVGASDFGFGSVSAAFKLAMESVKEANEATGAAYAKQKKDSEDWIKRQKEVLETLDKTSVAALRLEKRIEAREKQLKKEIQTLNAHTDAQEANTKAVSKGMEAYKKWSPVIAQVGRDITNSVAGYHQYNLAVQTAVDRTGKFGSEAQKSVKDFEKLRSSLNLTRAAALEFSGTFSDALRLNITNDQLIKMTKNLQKIHGQVAGLAMAKQLVNLSVGAKTLEGVIAKDPRAISMAARTGTSEDRQALVSHMRSAGNRPQAAQEAARFQEVTAKWDKLKDDIKMSIEGGLAAGLGADASAMMGPLTDINEKMSQLVSNTGPMKQFLTSMGGKLAGKAAGAAAQGIAGQVAGGAAGGTAAAGGGWWAGAKGLAGKAKGLAGRAAGSPITKTAGLAALPMIAGQLAGGAADWQASKYTDPADIEAKKAFQNLGAGARISGYAGAGAVIGSAVPGIGTAIGAGVGTGVGAAVEYKDPIIDGFKEGSNHLIKEWLGVTDYFVTESQKVYSKSDESIAQSIAGWEKEEARLEKQMAKLAGETENLSTTYEAQVAARRMEMGKMTEDRGMFAEAAKATEAGAAGKIEYAVPQLMKELADAEKAKAKDVANVREKQGVAASKGTEEMWNKTISSIKGNLQKTFEGADMEKASREGMARIETQRGQRVQERATAATRFKRVGEGTGSHEEALKYRESIVSGYEKEAKMFKEESSAAEQSLANAQALVEQQLAATNLTDQGRKLLEQEAKGWKAKREQLARTVASQEETMELNRQSELLAAEQTVITQYERTAAFQRAGQQKALATAEESYYRERGARPEEIGAAARTRATAATTQRAEYQKTAPGNIQRLTEQMEAARKGGNETLAIGYQNKILEIQKRGVELAHEEFKAKKESVTAEERFRQDTLGAQRTGLEIQAASAAKMGASWRVQMGYQSQIIKNSQEDLMSSRRELAAMADTIIKEGGSLNSKEYIDAQNKVLQKQANVQEQILGRQRGFLDQAIGAGFGMGGGTKFQPNVNAAQIFGEQVQGPGGMKQAGRPMTMGEQRQLLMQSAGTPITGAIGGGGIPAAPILPGAAGPAGAIGGAAAGAGGAAGGPGAAAGGGEGVDISGKIQLAVHFDTNMLKTEIRKEIIAAAKPGPRLA